MRKKGIDSISLRICLYSLLAFSFLPIQNNFAQTVKALPDTEAGMEALLFQDIPFVISAMGREQKQNEVACAMTVINKEDIEHSGAHNVADLLARVPGMQVKRVDSKRYFVGIRGEASLYTVNILVLIDGVVVFNPTYNGTNWELLPVSLSEIERIEVIRGQGGVLYSANAVNGVVNIITKKATDKDNYIAARGGSMDFRQEQLGVGKKINDKLSLRTFFNSDTSSGYDHLRSGNRTPNGSRDIVVGAKSQYDFSADSSLVIDWKHLEQNITYAAPGYMTVAYKKPGAMDLFLIDYNNKVNEAYDYKIDLSSMYLDVTTNRTYDTCVKTLEFITQHNIKYDFFGKNILSMGLDARWIKLRDDNVNFYPPYNDPNDSQKIDSVFMQNEYRPIDKLILSLGLRATDNTTVVKRKKLLYEPKGSIVYLLNDLNSLRASVGRSYRTPSLQELHAYGLASGNGNLNNEPERDITYEVGWQSLFLDKSLSMDTSLFYSDKKDLIFSNGTGPTDPDKGIKNNGSLITHGFELAVNYLLSSNWSLKGTYSFTMARVKPAFNGGAVQRMKVEDLSRNQIGAGAGYINKRFTADVYFKWVDSYYIATSHAKFPSFYMSSIRLAYAFKMPYMHMQTNDAEFEIVANDFIDAHKVEDNSNYMIEPDYYAGLKVRF